MIVYYGQSDIGLKRNVNEDYFLAGYNEKNDFIAIVCDGVAGSNAGDLASEIAAKSVFSDFEKSGDFSSVVAVKHWIYSACQNANDAIIFASKKNKKYTGMATTIVGVLVCNMGTFIFNIGDSRVYGLFDKFVCLTKDHNYERFIKEKGNTATMDLNTKKDALTNALGIYNVIEVDIIKIKDIWKKLLLTSDGVHNYVPAVDLLNVLLKNNHPQDKCQELINIAKRNSGKDNITAIVVERRNRYGKHN